MTIRERLNARTVPTLCPITVDRLGRPIRGDCLLWTGAIDRDGYGAIWDNDHGNNRKVHRVAFALANGRDPDGTVDHLCRVRACVNPAHLEDVTDRENIARGDTGLVNGTKTHCPQGHPYDETNTYWRKDIKGRHCRACNREKWREANGVSIDAPLRSERTSCVNGHEWTEQNTYWTRRSSTDPTLRRQCKACKRERSRTP